MTIIDTNILLDLVTDDRVWAEWSIAQLEAASLNGPLFINDIVYAELAARYESYELLDEFIVQAGLQMLPMPRAALFLAAKVHLAYRRAGGVRNGVLPDFFIGAQAAIHQLPILTRDTARFRTYFPSVGLVFPDEDS